MADIFKSKEEALDDIRAINKIKDSSGVDRVLAIRDFQTSRNAKQSIPTSSRRLPSSPPEVGSGKTAQEIFGDNLNFLKPKTSAEDNVPQSSETKQVAGASAEEIFGDKLKNLKPRKQSVQESGAVSEQPVEEDRGFIDSFLSLGEAVVEGGRQTLSRAESGVDVVTDDRESILEETKFTTELQKNSDLIEKKKFLNLATKNKDEDQSIFETIGDVADAFSEETLGGLQFVAEQAPNQVGSLGAGLIGAKAGATVGSFIPVVGTIAGGVTGFLVGMFGFNALQEVGGKAQEKSRDGDFTDEERGEAFKEGTVKAGVITAVDTLTLGGSRYMVGLKNTVVEKATTKALDKLNINTQGLLSDIKKATDGAVSTTATQAGTKLEKKVITNNLIKNIDDVANKYNLNSATVRKSVKDAQAKAVKSFEYASKKIGGNTLALAIETLGEGVGEYLGELIATGEASQVDAVLESLAGFTQSVASTTVSTPVDPLIKKVKKDLGSEPRADSLGGELTESVDRLIKFQDARAERISKAREEAGQELDRQAEEDTRKNFEKEYVKNILNDKNAGAIFYGMHRELGKEDTDLNRTRREQIESIVKKYKIDDVFNELDNSEEEVREEVSKTVRNAKFKKVFLDILDRYDPEKGVFFYDRKQQEVIKVGEIAKEETKKQDKVDLPDEDQLRGSVAKDIDPKDIDPKRPKFEFDKSELKKPAKEIDDKSKQDSPVKVLSGKTKEVKILSDRMFEFGDPPKDEPDEKTQKILGVGDREIQETTGTPQFELDKTPKEKARDESQKFIERMVAGNIRQSDDISGANIIAERKYANVRLTKNPRITDSTYKKDVAKASFATKFIGQGATNSSTDLYRKDFEAKGLANTGKYDKLDIVFISSNGKRPNRKFPDLREIKKAIQQNASFVIDGKKIRNQPYNVGERTVEKYLIDNNYVENSFENKGDRFKGISFWSPKTDVRGQATRLSPISDSFKAVVSKLTTTDISSASVAKRATQIRDKLINIGYSERQVNKYVGKEGEKVQELYEKTLSKDKPFVAILNDKKFDINKARAFIVAKTPLIKRVERKSQKQIEFEQELGKPTIYQLSRDPQVVLDKAFKIKNKLRLIEDVNNILRSIIGAEPVNTQYRLNDGEVKTLVAPKRIKQLDYQLQYKINPKAKNPYGLTIEQREKILKQIVTPAPIAFQEFLDDYELSMQQVRDNPMDKSYYSAKKMSPIVSIVIKNKIRKILLENRNVNIKFYGFGTSNAQTNDDLTLTKKEFVNALNEYKEAYANFGRKKDRIEGDIEFSDKQFENFEKFFERVRTGYNEKLAYGKTITVNEKDGIPNITFKNQPNPFVQEFNEIKQKYTLDETGLLIRKDFVNKNTKKLTDIFGYYDKHLEFFTPAIQEIDRLVAEGIGSKKRQTALDFSKIDPETGEITPRKVDFGTVDEDISVLTELIDELESQVENFVKEEDFNIEEFKSQIQENLKEYKDKLSYVPFDNGQFILPSEELNIDISTGRMKEDTPPEQFIASLQRTISALDKERDTLSQRKFMGNREKFVRGFELLKQSIRDVELRTLTSLSKEGTYLEQAHDRQSLFKYVVSTIKALEIQYAEFLEREADALRESTGSLSESDQAFDLDKLYNVNKIRKPKNFEIKKFQKIAELAFAEQGKAKTSTESEGFSEGRFALLQEAKKLLDAGELTLEDIKELYNTKGLDMPVTNQSLLSYLPMRKKLSTYLKEEGTGYKAVDEYFNSVFQLEKMLIKAVNQKGQQPVLKESKTASANLNNLLEQQRSTVPEFTWFGQKRVNLNPKITDKKSFYHKVFENQFQIDDYLNWRKESKDLVDRKHRMRDLDVSLKEPEEVTEKVLDKFLFTQFSLGRLQTVFNQVVQPRIDKTIQKDKPRTPYKISFRVAFEKVYGKDVSDKEKFLLEKYADLRPEQLIEAWHQDLFYAGKKYPQFRKLIKDKLVSPENMFEHKAWQKSKILRFQKEQALAMEKLQTFKSHDLEDNENYVYSKKTENQEIEDALADREFIQDGDSDSYFDNYIEQDSGRTIPMGLEDYDNAELPPIDSYERDIDNNYRASRLSLGAKSGVSSGLNVRRWFDEITKNWKIKPKVQIVNDIKYLNEPLRSRLYSKFGENTHLKGLYDGETGTIYLFSDYLSDKDDVEFTFFHEVVGHHGLRGILGDQFNETLENLYRTNPEIRLLADEKINDLNVGKLEGIEEAIADLAGRGQQLSVVRRIIKMLTKGLRKLGMNSVADYLDKISTNEVGLLLEKSFDFARNGGIKSFDGAPAPYRAKRPPIEIFGRRRNRNGEEKIIGYATYSHVTDKWTVYRSVPNQGQDVGLNEFVGTGNEYAHHTVDNFEQAMNMIKNMVVDRIDTRSTTPFYEGGRQPNEMETLYDRTRKEEGMRVKWYNRWMENVWQWTQNEYLPIFQAVKKAKNVNNGNDLRIFLQNYERRTAERLRAFKDDIVQTIFNLVETAGSKGATDDLLNEYLLATGAEERNIQTLKNNNVPTDIVKAYTSIVRNRDLSIGQIRSELIKQFPDKEDLISGLNLAGSGMSKMGHNLPNGDRAIGYQEVIQKVESSKFAKEFKEIAETLDDLGDSKIDLMLASELISPADASKRKEAYKHYRTMAGVKDSLDEDPFQLFQQLTGGAVGKKFNIRGKDSQTAQGRLGFAPNILAQTLTSYQTAIVRAEKNLIARRVLTFLEMNYDPDFVAIEPNDALKIIDANGNEKYTNEVNLIKDPTIFFARVGGRAIQMRFTNTEKGSFAQAINGFVYPETSNIVVRTIQAITRFTGRLLTTWNPYWVPINFIRDLQTVYTNLDIDIGKGAGREAMRLIPTAIRVSLYARIRDWNPNPNYVNKFKFITQGMGAQAVKKTLMTLLKYASINQNNPRDFEMLLATYDEGKKAGGFTSFLNREGMDEQVAQIGRLMNTMKNNKDGNMFVYGGKAFARGARDFGGMMSGLLEFMTIPMEMAPRLSAYAVARSPEYGNMDKQRSANLSGEISVNFNMRGSVSLFRAFYLFFNPAIQGTAKIMKMAVQNPRRFAINAGFWVMLGIISNFLSRTLGGGDDEGDDLEKLPHYKRATTFILIPNLEGFAFPIAYGWNAFYSIGHFFPDSIIGNKTYAETGKNIASAVFEAFSPIAQGVGDAKSFETALLKTVAPTSMQGMFEYWFNENRFGTPIYKEQTFNQPEGSDVMNAFRNVNPLSQRAVRRLQELTGGNIYNKDGIDINPALIDHMVRNHLGGIPNELWQKWGRNERRKLGIDLTEEQTYVARRFSAMIPERRHVGLYLEMSKKIKTLAVEAEKLPFDAQALRDPNRKQTLLDKHPDIFEMAEMIKQVEQNLKQINKDYNMLSDYNERIRIEQGQEDKFMRDMLVERLNLINSTKQELYKMVIGTLIDRGYRDDLKKKP